MREHVELNIFLPTILGGDLDLFFLSTFLSLIVSLEFGVTLLDLCVKGSAPSEELAGRWILP